jgi:hypothetical protein
LDKLPPRNTALGGLLNFFRSHNENSVLTLLAFHKQLLLQKTKRLKERTHLPKTKQRKERTHLSKTNAHTAVKTICSQDHTPGHAAYPARKFHSPVGDRAGIGAIAAACLPVSIVPGSLGEIRPILPSKQWLGNEKPHGVVKRLDIILHFLIDNRFAESQHLAQIALILREHSERNNYGLNQFR